MQLYSCKIRLNSNVMHEVMKVVTVPELILLRIVHGKIGENSGGFEPVVDVKILKDRFLMARDNPGDAEDKGEHKITDTEERARLNKLYGVALHRSKDYPSLDAIFGVGQPLPKTAEGVPNVVVLDKPAKRTVVPDKPDDLAELA